MELTEKRQQEVLLTATNFNQYGMDGDLTGDNLSITYNNHSFNIKIYNDQKFYQIKPFHSNIDDMVEILNKLAKDNEYDLNDVITSLKDFINRVENIRYENIVCDDIRKYLDDINKFDIDIEKKCHELKLSCEDDPLRDYLHKVIDMYKDTITDLKNHPNIEVKLDDKESIRQWEITYKNFYNSKMKESLKKVNKDNIQMIISFSNPDYPPVFILDTRVNNKLNCKIPQMKAVNRNFKRDDIKMYEVIRTVNSILNNGVSIDDTRPKITNIEVFVNALFNMAPFLSISEEIDRINPESTVDGNLEQICGERELFYLKKILDSLDVNYENYMSLSMTLFWRYVVHYFKIGEIYTNTIANICRTLLAIMNKFHSNDHSNLIPKYAIDSLKLMYKKYNNNNQTIFTPDELKTMNNIITSHKESLKGVRVNGTVSCKDYRSSMINAYQDCTNRFSSLDEETQSNMFTFNVEPTNMGCKKLSEIHRYINTFSKYQNNNINYEKGSIIYITSSSVRQGILVLISPKESIIPLSVFVFEVYIPSDFDTTPPKIRYISYNNNKKESLIHPYINSEGYINPYFVPLLESSSSSNTSGWTKGKELYSLFAQLEESLFSNELFDKIQKYTNIDQKNFDNEIYTCFSINNKDKLKKEIISKTIENGIYLPITKSRLLSDLIDTHFKFAKSDACNYYHKEIISSRKNEYSIHSRRICQNVSEELRQL